MNINTLTTTKFFWSLTIGLALLVYLVGMFVTIMEIDAAVYAEISREMASSGNFADIMFKGQDWLDKPHFQFWVTAIFFKLFGVTSFTYKIPAVLAMLLGVYYTYKFGAKYYSKKHGYLAALILMTAQHILTSNSDVRAEPYLTGFTIMALYHIATWLREKKPVHMLLGSLALALLLMTKGLFTVIPVGAGIGLALAVEGRWKSVFHWQWVAIGALTFVFTLPTIYNYYLQFDLQPEKLVFGEKGVSGVKFFFWDSQWGRFTNTGPIKGKGDPTFFLHTLLWAFMPWAFLAYFGLFRKSKELISRHHRHENYTFFGFLFMLIIFSISSFQLPHYLNAIFPFLAIITTDGLNSFAKDTRVLRVFGHIQIWSVALLIMAVIALHIVFSTNPASLDVYLIFFFGLTIIAILFIQKGQWFRKIIFIPAICILIVNYYINRSFYPALLKYQAESEVSFYMDKFDLHDHEIVVLGVNERMLSFLQQRVIPAYALDEATADAMSEKYIFTDDTGKKYLESMSFIVSEIKSFEDFPVTTLNGKFLNQRTRSEAVKTKYLLKTSRLLSSQ